MIVSIIPVAYRNRVTRVKDFYGLFPDGNYFEPTNFDWTDYNEADSHFNNKGHKKYADFLQHLIDSVYATRLPQAN